MGCILCLFLIGCSQEESDGYERVQVMSDYIMYETVEDMEKHADLIIVGTFIGDSRQEIYKEYDKRFEKEVLVDINTFMNVRIDRVIQGSANIEDIVEVVQSYGYVEETKQMICFSAMTPMEEGTQWLFFLKKSNQGEMYYCVGDYTGRYPLPKDLEGEAYTHILQMGALKRDWMQGKEPLPKLQEGEELDITKHYFGNNGDIYLIESPEDVTFLDTWENHYKRCCELLSPEDFGVYEIGAVNLVLYEELL